MSLWHSGKVKPMGWALVGCFLVLWPVQTVLQVNPVLDAHLESGNKTSWKINYTVIVAIGSLLLFLPVLSL